MTPRTMYRRRRWALSRRDFLTGVATTAAAWGTVLGLRREPLPPLAPAVDRAAEGAARPVTLNVWASPDNADVLADIATRFTEQNPPITVTVTPIAWEVLFPQILADVASRAGAFDVATWDVLATGVVGASFLDLDAFRKVHPDLVDANYDLPDFDPGVWHVGGIWAGKNIGIPFSNDTMLFYYRKDVFSDHPLRAAFLEKYNRPLGVPKTWGETADVAAFFTQRVNPASPTPYGIGLMFPHTPTLFSMYVLYWADYRRSAAGLAEWGKVDLDYGDYFTSARMPAFANTFGVRALQDMKTLMPYSPDPLRSDYAQAIEHFSKGTVAMVPHWTSAWASFKQSQVLLPLDEKVGVAVVPGAHSVGGIWGLGINRVTKHPVEAFKFLQWATNSQNDKQKFVNFGVGPARISTLRDPEIRTADPRVPALLETYPAQGYRPRIQSEPQLEEVTVEALSQILGGRKSNNTAALQALAAEWEKIVK